MNSQSKPPSTLYRSVSRAAVALALGGKFIRQALGHNRVVLFEIIPPEGLDFDDPDLMVPVPALLAWTEALTARIRTFNIERIKGQPLTLHLASSRPAVDSPALDSDVEGNR